MKIKTLLALCLSITAFHAFSHAVVATDAVPLPGASPRIDAIRQRGVLRVAVLDEYPWLKRRIEGAPFEGPAWILAQAFAHRLGVRLETMPVDFDSKITILAQGEADITIAPLLETPARKQQVDFISYSMSAQCLFGRADNPKLTQVRNLDALNQPGITIAFINHSMQGDWLQKRLPNARRDGIDGNITSVALDEVTSGRADVAPVDKFFFAALEKKTPGLTAVPMRQPCLESEALPIAIGMAIAKDQPRFLLWLRAVAAIVKPQVEAEQTRVVKAGE